MLSAYYRSSTWFTLDGEHAWSHARFVDVPADESYIPGAVEHMLAAGVTVGKEEGVYSSLRARYFAPRPLEESGTVESKAGFQVNARLGYRWKNWDVAVSRKADGCVFQNKIMVILFSHDFPLRAAALSCLHGDSTASGWQRG